MDCCYDGHCMAWFKSFGYEKTWVIVKFLIPEEGDHLISLGERLNPLLDNRDNLDERGLSGCARSEAGGDVEEWFNFACKDRVRQISNVNPVHPFEFFHVEHRPRFCHSFQ